MLTPAFELNQDEKFVYIYIKTPYIKVREHLHVVFQAKLVILFSSAEVVLVAVYRTFNLMSVHSKYFNMDKQRRVLH